MSTSIPTIEPASFTAGETVKFNITHSDYPASLGALSYYWVNASGAFTESTSTPNGDTFEVVITAAATRAVAAGSYSFQARYIETSSSEEKIISSGVTCVLAEFIDGAYDNRTWAKKALDAIEITIQALVEKTSVSMSVQGRSRADRDLAEAYTTRDKLKAEVRAEEAAKSVANGLGNPNVIRTRF